MSKFPINNHNVILLEFAIRLEFPCILPIKRQKHQMLAIKTGRGFFVVKAKRTVASSLIIIDHAVLKQLVPLINTWYNEREIVSGTFYRFFFSKLGETKAEGEVFNTLV